MDAGYLDTVLYDLVRLSRPTSEASRRTALNYGLRLFVDAIKTARPEYFLQEAVITVPANQLRVTLDGEEFPLSVKRILKIGSLGASAPTIDGTASAASTRYVEWRYSQMMSQEFRAAEAGGARDEGVVCYDLIFPGGVPTLAVAPALATETQVMISSLYEPSSFVASDDELEPIVADYYEAVVFYACELLLATVDDAAANGWKGRADRVLMNAVNSVGRPSDQGSSHFGSDLYFGDV